MILTQLHSTSGPASSYFCFHTLPTLYFIALAWPLVDIACDFKLVKALIVFNGFWWFAMVCDGFLQLLTVFNVLWGFSTVVKLQCFAMFCQVFCYLWSYFLGYIFLSMVLRRYFICTTLPTSNFMLRLGLWWSHHSKPASHVKGGHPSTLTPITLSFSILGHLAYLVLSYLLYLYLSHLSELC